MSWINLNLLPLKKYADLVIISLLDHQRVSKKAEKMIGRLLNVHTSVMLYFPDKDQVEIMHDNRPSVQKNIASVKELYDLMHKMP